MNVHVVVEPALYMYKQEEEATKVNIDQQQGATHLREIQCQVNIES